MRCKKSFCLFIATALLASSCQQTQELPAKNNQPVNSIAGHYVSDGYHKRHEGYDWLVVSVSEERNGHRKMSVRSRIDIKDPSCTFDTEIIHRDDNIYTTELDGQVMLFTFTEDNLSIFSERFNERFALIVFCSGGGSLAGDYLRIHEELDRTNLDPSPYDDSWRKALSFSTTDEHGHGPDEGSEEAARSIVWQFIYADETYQQDGYGLVIRSTIAYPETPGRYLVTYLHRHYGDPGMFYSGEVIVNGSRASHLPHSQQFVGVAQILETLFREALENDAGDPNRTIVNDTPIHTILQTEHQFMALHDGLQNLYNLDYEAMQSFWAELSKRETFGDWVIYLNSL